MMYGSTNTHDGVRLSFVRMVRPNQSNTQAVIDTIDAYSGIADRARALKADLTANGNVPPDRRRAVLAETVRRDLMPAIAHIDRTIRGSLSSPQPTARDNFGAAVAAQVHYRRLVREVSGLGEFEFNSLMDQIDGSTGKAGA